MKKVALVRGKFLNQYEMQSFAPLVKRYEITAFSSLHPFHDQLPFPVVKLVSPMDLVEFPYKMSILNRLFIDAHYLWGLENQLRGFDLVHTAETYYHYTQQCLNAKKYRLVKKVIATVLENIPRNNEKIWGRKIFKQRSRKELDHIIALTHKTREALLVEGTDSAKITVIGHGIDTKRFLPDATHWKKLVNQKHPLTILFCGRLEEYKGVFEVFEAFKILIRQGTMSKGQKEIRLMLVGEGGEKGKLEREIVDSGLQNKIQIKNVSYEQMSEVYRQADIFVAPSKSTPTWQEQYCTVLLEAQSMGLPIVTTYSGGIPENTSNCVLYVEEGNAKSLAQQLTRFITDPLLRLTYGKKARKRAETVHDATIIARKISDVYERVLV